MTTQEHAELRETIHRLRHERDEAREELAKERAKQRWITVRRVGGEHDAMARVFVDYEVGGATITLGSELLASNFSSGWNLTAHENDPKPEGVRL